MIYNLTCERQQINKAGTRSGIHIRSGVEKGSRALFLLNIQRLWHIGNACQLFPGTLCQFFVISEKMCGIVFIHLKGPKLLILVMGKYSVLCQPDGLSSLRLRQGQLYHSTFCIRKEKVEWVDEGCQTDHVFFLERVPITADKLVWKQLAAISLCKTQVKKKGSHI